jgi:small-conductance mechanosensitive channel
MLSWTLFKLGPYNVCLWNIILLAIIFFTSIILRRVIHRYLRRYLKSANIRLEGRGLTWLKLISQSIYILAFYIAIISFNINNEDVTFTDFLDFNIIETRKFTLSFYHILVIFAVFFGARMLLNIVKIYISKKFRNKPDFNAGTEFIYVQIAKYVIYIFAILISLKAVEIDLSLLITGSLGIFVGIGLGLQDVFKDMFSGFVLLFEGNVRVGDIVEISNGGKSDAIVAKILKINVRTTQIETREGNVLILPNSKLTQEYVENWSHGSDLSRFMIKVSVAYGTDCELVSRLLKQAALAHPKVRKSEPVEARLSNFGNNGLELDLVFWADQSWDINLHKSEIRFEIDRLFRQYEIVIPFPQSTIHFADNTILK